MSVNLQQQFDLVTAAPLVFIVVATGLILTTVAVMRWLYSHRLDGMKEDYDRLQRKVEELEASLSAANAAATEAAKAPKPGVRSTAMDNLKIEMSHLKTDVMHARAGRNQAGFARLAPRFEALFISIAQATGISAPCRHRLDGVYVDAMSRLLEEIDPLISAGHFAEARQKVEAWEKTNPFAASEERMKVPWSRTAYLT